jgi:hypothetical protein
LVDWGFIVTRRGTVRRSVSRLGTCVCSRDTWPQRRCVVTRRRVTVDILFKYQMPNYEEDNHCVPAHQPTKETRVR